MANTRIRGIYSGALTKLLLGNGFDTASHLHACVVNDRITGHNPVVAL